MNEDSLDILDYSPIVEEMALIDGEKPSKMILAIALARIAALRVHEAFQKELSEALAEKGLIALDYTRFTFSESGKYLIQCEQTGNSEGSYILNKPYDLAQMDEEKDWVFETCFARYIRWRALEKETSKPRPYEPNIYTKPKINYPKDSFWSDLGEVKIRDGSIKEPKQSMRGIMDYIKQEPTLPIPEGFSIKEWNGLSLSAKTAIFNLQNKAGSKVKQEQPNMNKRAIDI